jgi:hypothetical protein
MGGVFGQMFERDDPVAVAADERRVRSSPAMRFVLGGVAAIACAFFASSAHALPVVGGGCGGLTQPACPATPAPQNAAPAGCTDPSGNSYLGTTDQNASDTIPMPRLGAPLIPRRRDGHVPFGFNDLAYLVRNTTPNVGFSAAQDVAAHAGAGSSLVRFPLSWGSLESTRGSIDWANVDQLYCADVRAGIGIVFTILGSPKWAVVGGQRCSYDGYCMAPPDSQYDGALQSFARAVAIRYPHVAAIEAWNEPNHGVFWQSPLPGGAGPDPARYTAVLKAVFTGVKSGNPSIPVLGGGLGNGRNTPADYTLGDFLSGMYDNGAQRWMDGLSFHAYPVYPRSSGRADEFHKTMSTVRSLVAARDSAGRRLWPDEMGAALSQTSQPFTEHEQSADLLSDYRELDGAGDVDAVLFHTLIDDNEWGWLKPRDSQGHVYPRPVYCAFAESYGDPLDVGAPTSNVPASTSHANKRRKARRHRGRPKHHTMGRTKSHRHRRKRARSAERVDCSKPIRLPSA